MKSYTYHGRYRVIENGESICADLPLEYSALWATVISRNSETGIGAVHDPGLSHYRCTAEIHCQRTVGGCTKAIQFITLCPGAFVKQFEDQKAGLYNIRHMVYRSLNEVMPQPRYRESELFFHRKVFNMVHVRSIISSLPCPCIQAC